MPLQAIDVAITQLGVHELTGHNDGLPAIRFMDGDELEWCAGFALYCNAHSDDPKVAPDVWTHYALRNVEVFRQHLIRNGCYIEHSVALPQRNDFIFFGHGHADVGVSGSHIGLTESVIGGRVRTVEGNSANRVARRDYALTDPTILGYGRVTFALPSLHKPKA